MGNLKEKVDKKQKRSKKDNNSKFSEKDVMIKKEDERSKVNKPAEKKKRKREKGKNFDGGDAIQTSREDDRTKAEGEKKMNKLRKKKQRSEEQNNTLVGKYHQPGSESEVGFNEQKCKSKKTKKKKKEHDTSKEENKVEKRGETDHGEAYCISSVDEDCSKGLKKWLTDYHQSRPGLKVLQQRLDEFIISHEEKLEQERKEREAQVAEGGWTVVKHHKGRKKTTDSESGITVGSVAPAAVENQMTKKKPKEVGLEFYRFQKREAQRSEIMALRSKFEEDRKRIQQLRAARKFRPY